MAKFRIVLAFAVTLVLAFAPGCSRRRAKKREAVAAPLTEALAYPATRTVDHKDEYHGASVADPYRWLEEFESEEAKAWVAAQNEVTFAHLRSIRSRDRIKKRLEKLWNYERFGVPWREGDRYFYYRNDGLQDHSVLLVADSLDGDTRVLLDPNTLSEDKSVSVASESVSHDGRYLAYAISRGGSDWREVFVRDVETGEDLAGDHLKWVKFSGMDWARDNSGFYYSRMPTPAEGAELKAANYNQKVYFHRLGTPQEEDALVYERPDHPDWGLGASVSEDGRWLVIWVWKGSSGTNAVFMKDLAADGPVVEVLPKFDARYWPLGNDGSKWWVYTNKDAPKGRVVQIDVENPAPELWRELIPESKAAVRNAEIIGDRILIHSLKYAHSQVLLYQLDGTLERKLELPGVGSASRFKGRRSSRELFFRYSSFTDPSSSLRYDFETGKLEFFKRPRVDFDPDDYTTRQVAYTSKDGQDVTMFIVHKTGIQLDGHNPTILYGYGGFNSAQRPGFNPARIVWMELGGVYAVANLRGGGEYGEEWHKAGMLEKKQNVFDDFIAAG
ncbi:MAG: S9 family peptidase, partial [Planctomycetota bacterium]|nr:S9 family peptidase [Planctomycetota bacterium]